MNRKKLRMALMIVLAAVLAVSLTMLLRQMAQYREGEAEYTEAEELAGLPDLSQLDITPSAVPPVSAEDDAGSAAEADASAPPQAPVYVDPYADALAQMDFTALQTVNSDVLGWILIPNTKISYPLVQGSDNSYYLNHTWKKWNSVVGAIFMEQGNQRDFSDFNTIIYGHRMNNGSMFAGLKYYKKQSYCAAHPAVYITDGAGTRKYDIFAAYEVSTQGDTYRIGQRSGESKQAYIDYCLSQSLYDTGVVPTVYDKIVTLSTCTGNGHATRWVVQARLQGQPPAPEEDTAPAGEDTGSGDTPLSEDTAPVSGDTPPPEDTAPAGEDTGSGDTPLSEDTVPVSGDTPPEDTPALAEDMTAGSDAYEPTAS